jgi:hypothetical protein
VDPDPADAGAFRLGVGTEAVINTVRLDVQPRASGWSQFGCPIDAPSGSFLPSWRWVAPPSAAQLQVDRHGRLTGRLKSNERTIYIPTQVVSDLRQHKIRSRYKGESDFVFAAPGGLRPRTQEWARKTWVAARGRAGITRQVRFHDLRHTFASILISNGASATELAEQLGDSVKVALETYASLFNRAGSETKLRAILSASYPTRQLVAAAEAS